MFVHWQRKDSGTNNTKCSERMLETLKGGGQWGRPNSKAAAGGSLSHKGLHRGSESGGKVGVRRGILCALVWDTVQDELRAFLRRLPWLPWNWDQGSFGGCMTITVFSQIAASILIDAENELVTGCISHLNKWIPQSNRRLLVSH